MIKQLLKDVLRSKYVPELLFKLYFKRKEQRNRQKLKKLLFSGQDLMMAVPEQQREHWNPRIEKVISAPENKNITRVDQAGKMVDGNLIMHNGIKVDSLSYYSFPLLKMLMENQGVHEPEEERIFQEVIQNMQEKEEITMLELGSYWSFYSMWFQQRFPKAKNFMVEPDRKNLIYGKKNFRINGMKGKFIYSGIGRKRQPQKNITSVDEICKRKSIQYIDILHSDIQGFELEMLEGSTTMFSNHKIGYVFISTHSDKLHEQCTAMLLDFNYSEVANINLQKSSSWDGIIVMKSPDYHGVSKVSIETKTNEG